MILPGLEGMNFERIRGIIAYKRQLRFALPELQREVARLSNFANPEAYADQFPSDAPYAHLHAAELAFAIDDVALGVELLTEVVTSDQVNPRTIMQLCWFAIAGAITGILSVKLTPFSFSIGSSSADQLGDTLLRTVPWPEESVVAVEIARRLLSASFSSNPDTFDVGGVEQMSEGSFGKAALRALQLTPEYQAILELWGHGAKYPSFSSGRVDLEVSFVERTRRAFRRTELHPSVPRGIVDFGLLGIYVGLERQNAAEFPDSRESAPELAFLRSVATQIASVTPPFDRRQRRFQER
jgi:hypothetical protein